MKELFSTLSYYITFSYVRYALITGTLIALCSALLGVTLVLRRFSFIGDGLSHVAFGALSFAAVFGLTNKMALVLPATTICAVLLLCGGEKRKVKGDASVAMISTGSLAVGYLLMNIFAPSANVSGDVCSTLFGSTSILTLTRGEVLACIVLSVAVMAIFVLLYNRLFTITFDEDFARTTGLRTGRYNLLLSVVIAVIIVLAMNLVGSLLISALVVFPALSAMRLCNSFRGVTICAAIMSTVCALLGMIVAMLAATPVGSTIVVTDMALFAVCSLIACIKKRG